MVGGSVLDARERRVDLEHVGDGLCATNAELVGPDAASEGGCGVRGP